MKHYAGLDVSQQTTSICIVDEEGGIVAERKVTTCPDVIAAALEPFAEPAAAGVEGFQIRCGARAGRYGHRGARH